MTRFILGAVVGFFLTIAIIVANLEISYFFLALTADAISQLTRSEK